MRLSRYGDLIGARTGLGGTWIGLILMASVTSFPELVTGASAILVFDVPDIAAGDAIGSCMFNLLILALLDARDGEPLSARIHQGHVLAAAFGIVQLGFAALAMLAGPYALRVGWIDIHSLVFVAVYVLAVRTISAFERKRMAEVAEAVGPSVDEAQVSLRDAVARFAGSAVVLVAAATVLPGVGERLSELAGIGQSFVGNVFIAASTSLPEIVVSVAAVRIGAIDMAAANLFGSNVFNIAVLGVDDLLYVRGSLLGVVSRSHFVGLAGAIVMTAVAIIALTYRAQRKRLMFSWDALAMIAVYVLAISLLRFLA